MGKQKGCLVNIAFEIFFDIPADKKKETRIFHRHILYRVCVEHRCGRLAMTFPEWYNLGKTCAVLSDGIEHDCMHGGVVP